MPFGTHKFSVCAYIAQIKDLITEETLFSLCRKTPKHKLHLSKLLTNSEIFLNL